MTVSPAALKLVAVSKDLTTDKEGAGTSATTKENVNESRDEQILSSAKAVVVSLTIAVPAGAVTVAVIVKNLDSPTGTSIPLQSPVMGL